MTSAPRLSTVILPLYRWAEGRRVWQRAEDLGFGTAYTYDHLTWREPFRQGPWYGAVPTLTAAAGVTTRMRLGTLVTSPNFRHPVTLAKELLTLDDVSAGRVTLGLGAGTSGPDATALGQEAWSPRERADRFAEFVALLDRLLTEDATTGEGRYYSAHEARGIPGCVQKPRLPFAVAATGPRGMRLAARYGQAWVTTGDLAVHADPAATAEQSRRAVAAQVARFGELCAEEGRDPADVHKVMLTGFTPDTPLASLEAFLDCAGAYGAAGIDEFVLHWPVPDTLFAADQAVFEEIAAEAPSRMG
jgi:alkanesulfonate monooxygenase SsuD/methylene tetrahydromethanopterin reductase-like flavin-dependent oxidoreductase (luciferase family)